jgi:hypothetical protein
MDLERYMRSRVYFAVFVAAVSILAACGNSGNGTGGNSADTGHAALGHIHGLGVNPADGALYAGSHHGVFRISGDGVAEQIAGRTQDFMGFTIVGPDHFLASGHPGPGDTSQPPHLGLIESTDAAETWTSVSLGGEADFHAMEAKHDRIYVYDSQSGQLMVSTDRRNWDRRAQIGIADIAVAPDQPEEIIATTRQGPARSADGGRTFAVLPNAPILGLVDWPNTARLVGAAPDGTVYVSPDRGVTWTRHGQVAGSPAAITTLGEADIYIATEDTIQRSTDNGATFTVFQRF